jgi:rhodanese-related sulfurtransferase
MAWTDVKLNVWDRLSHILSRIPTRSAMKTKGRYPGMEVLGLNGRAVYFEWNDGILTWEAYENDGATILKGRVPVDSAWEGKADRMLRSVLEGREAKVATEPDEKAIVHEALQEFLKSTDKDWNYVTPVEFEKMDKKNLFLLDIRKPEDFKKEHIEGATNIFWLDLLNPENLAKLPKDKKIVLICYVGHTSSQAIVLLKLLGYDVMALKFGMGKSPVEGVPVAGWLDYGFETVKEREARIARRLEAEDVREWDSLRRGDYIRSRMGEGYVVAWLPTGEIVINMRKSAREGTRVDKSDISGVWNSKTKKWDRLA